MESAVALPINLDANSSELDRVTGHVIFRGLKISQGQVAVQADTGEASRLDFDDSRWSFTGHVVLDNGSTRAFCDGAELSFVGHQLRLAVLKGTPARFEQYAALQPAKGRANSLEYDLDAARIRLSGDAWVTDGSNEVSGEQLSYDLRKSIVLADATGGKQVRMRISPPARKGPAGTSP